MALADGCHRETLNATPGKYLAAVNDALQASHALAEPIGTA
jgi:hypothetical protein